MADKDQAGDAISKLEATGPEYATSMSLRDYFAGQALALAAAIDHQQRIDESRVGVFRGYTKADVAANAYGIADAMLKERAK